MIKSSFFQDRSQNFWQLASIQSASVGFSGLVLGGQLAAEFGPQTAFLSISIGNLILWLIGMGMISMSSSKRNPVFQNVIQNFGNATAIIASFTLIFAFIIWYAIQIELATSVFDNIIVHQSNSEKFDLITGVWIGLLIAFLSMGGIRIIKWICLFGFPILLCFIIYVFACFEHSNTFDGNWELSVSAIISTLAATLVGMINIPTFFKHSRSKADSFLGLTLMTLFTTLLQSSSIMLRYDKLNENLITFIGNEFNYFFILFFISSSLICINLVNIYFASAGMDMIISRFFKSQYALITKYGLVGLTGTVIFAFVQISSPMLFLVNLAADFLANLGIVLSLAFLVNNIIRHKLIKLEKFINNTCWFIGCIVSLVIQTLHPENVSLAFIWGIGSCILAFLISVFIVETTWSLKIVQKEN